MWIKLLLDHPYSHYEVGHGAMKEQPFSVQPKSEHDRKRPWSNLEERIYDEVHTIVQTSTETADPVLAIFCKLAVTSVSGV